jgi:hypothetical protein
MAKKSTTVKVNRPKISEIKKAVGSGLSTFIFEACYDICVPRITQEQKSILRSETNRLIKDEVRVNGTIINQAIELIDINAKMLIKYYMLMDKYIYLNSVWIDGVDGLKSNEVCLSKTEQDTIIGTPVSIIDFDVMAKEFTHECQRLKHENDYLNLIIGQYIKLLNVDN